MGGRRVIDKQRSERAVEQIMYHENLYPESRNSTHVVTKNGKVKVITGVTSIKQTQKERIRNVEGREEALGVHDASKNNKINTQQNDSAEQRINIHNNHKT